MFHHRKNMVLFLNLFLMLALAGCGQQGDRPASPTASISGEGGNTPTTGGTQGPALEKPASDPRHPVVLVETSLGNMTLQLDAEKAPLTVDNFLSYVRSGYYDQTIVHQVYKNQGILAGGYGVNFVEKPTRTPVRNEADNRLKNLRGTIAMVRLPDAIDSAACQFIVNVADNAVLDFKDRTPEGYGYCVFGKVVEGMGVVDRIAAAPVHDTSDFECTPAETIVIKSIRQLR